MAEELAEEKVLTQADYMDLVDIPSTPLEEPVKAKEKVPEEEKVGEVKEEEKVGEAKEVEEGIKVKEPEAAKETPKEAGPEEAAKELKAPKEQEEEDALTILTSDNDALRLQVVELAKQALLSTPPVKEPPAKEQEGEKLKPQEAAQITVPPTKLELGKLEVKDLLTKDELGKVLDQPDLINIAIARGVEKVMAHLGEALPGLINPLQQEVARLPSQVGDIVSRRMEFAGLRTGFYTENPDLEGFASFVDFSFQQLSRAALDSGEKVTLGALYTKAGESARELLKLPKKSKQPERRVALVGVKGAKKAAAVKKSSGNKTQSDFMAELD